MGRHQHHAAPSKHGDNFVQMSQNNKSNIQTGKYAAAKDIFFLTIILSALSIIFLNLPGMLAIAYYDQNVRLLSVTQCWTFSLCATLGILLIFRLLSGKFKPALKTHLLLSFAVAAYLAVAYFGFGNQFSIKYLGLYLPADFAQQL